MAAQTANQKAYSLIARFEKNYISKYGKKPALNRHREKWGFQDMVEDLGYDTAQEVVDYYFGLTTYIGHPVQQLLRNYDRFNSIIIERREDEKLRMELREQTRLRVEEYERKNVSRD